MITDKSIVIQNLNPEDFLECFEVERNCFPVVEMFLRHEIKEIIEYSQIAIKAVIEGKMVGYALARHANRIGYLYSNAVLYPYRNKGIGYALLEHRCHLLWEKCDVIQAHTRTDNKMSARLLLKYGFKAIEYVTDFYDDNVDATKWEVRV